MASMTRIPAKIFWEVPNSMAINNYFCLDKILGELTCSTCYFQCYGRTKMVKHIEDKHRENDVNDVMDVQAPGQSPKVIVEKINPNLDLSMDNLNLRLDEDFVAENQTVGDSSTLVDQPMQNPDPESNHVYVDNVPFEEMDVTPDNDQDSVDSEAETDCGTELNDDSGTEPNSVFESGCSGNTGLLGTENKSGVEQSSESESWTSRIAGYPAAGNGGVLHETIQLMSETESGTERNHISGFENIDKSETDPNSKPETTFSRVTRTTRTSACSEAKTKFGTGQNYESRTEKNSEFESGFSPAGVVHEISEQEIQNHNSSDNLDNSITPNNLSNLKSYHIEDPVFGELVCDFCLYTNFSKRVMINHLKKKHNWVEPLVVKTNDAFEAPIIEVPAPISPIHEKHVTFSDEDTIITDDDIVITEYSKADQFDFTNAETEAVESNVQPLAKKKPFIYDGSEIINKILNAGMAEP